MEQVKNQFTPVYKTSAGYVAYGSTQVILEECLNKIKEVPKIFIIPGTMFNRKNGQFIGVFEIPIFYNLLNKLGKTKIVGTMEQIESIKPYLIETLLVSDANNKQNIKTEFHSSYDISSYPDFEKEAFLIKEYILGIGNPNTLDSIVEFVPFNELGIADISPNVRIKRNENHIRVEEEKSLLGEFNIIKTDQDITQNLYNTALSIISKYKMPEQPFEPPLFGLTPISSPFADSKATSAILWINGRAAVIDPPINFSNYLQQFNISLNIIDWIILTHCHDNDLGVLQRFVESSRMEIITTMTIINSFIKKYSKVTQINAELFRKLFKFKPVIIGAPINLNGCIIRFQYNFHIIPCISIEISNQNKSIYYSADTHYNPYLYQKFSKARFMNQKRYELIANQKFIHTLIFFDCGNLYCTTPLTIFQQQFSAQLDTLYLMNISQKEIIDKINQQENPKQIYGKIQGVKSEQQINVPNQAIVDVVKQLNVLIPGIDQTIKIEVKKFKSMNYTMKLEILALIDVFEGLTLKNLRDLIDISNEEYYVAGQIIIKQGTVGSKWYILLKGQATIFSESVPPLFLPRKYMQGEYFGEAALKITSGSTPVRRMASVIADTDVTVLTLEKQDFWFAFGQGVQSMGAKILEKQARLLVSRQLGAFKIIGQNSFFKDLKISQQTQFEMILQPIEVQSGQSIWKIGESAKFAICIIRGEFIFADCVEAEKNIVFKFGNFVGEIESLVNCSEHNTSLQAKTSGAYFKIDRLDLLGFLRRNPGLFLSISEVKYII